MEHEMMMWCAWCMKDALHRYVREDEYRKFYECLDCECPNHVWVRVDVEIKPRGIKKLPPSNRVPKNTR